MNLLLKNVLIRRGGRTLKTDLSIRHNRIESLEPGLAPRRREKVVDAGEYFALPGLINAHDHLDLNVFPRLGNQRFKKHSYGNFYQWAEDIYHPGHSPLKELLSIPLYYRLLWGAFKNILSGVTTVVHHNPLFRPLRSAGFPVRVLQKYGWEHSPGHGSNLVGAFRRSRKRPFIIHAAEGTDARAAGEIEHLEALGILAPNTVLVRGVAINPGHFPLLRQRQPSLIWCPASNFFLFGKTACISQLHRHLKIALGTDSTLSGSPSLLEELQVARDADQVSPEDLFNMVTTLPADIFRLRDGRGRLEPGLPADIFLVPETESDPVVSLLNSACRDIPLVMVNGEPRYVARKHLGELDIAEPNVWIDDEPGWLYGNPLEVKKALLKKADESLLEQNPLWNRIQTEPIPLTKEKTVA